MGFKITSEDVDKILQYNISDRLKEQIDSYNLSYDLLDNKQKESYLINVIDVLTKDIVESGDHRINDWENGWKENLLDFKLTKNFSSLVPKYHDKNRYARWKGQIVKPLVNGFDYKLHISFLDSIIEKYSKDVENLYEFGCGPAYHLLRYSKLFPHLKLHGMDWTNASQNIIREINNNFNLDIECQNFNFFNPDFNLNIKNNSLITTIAALEQTGERFTKFIDYLLIKKPKLCINIEPISEVLDKDNLIDYLSIKYFEKRKYLKKYLPYLQNLEKENKIKILEIKRLYYGSFFIEGHTLIVWHPL